MYILQWILLALIGLSLGFVVASGVVSLIIGLGIVNRYAGITKTAPRLRWYEFCCMTGAFFGNVFCMLDHSPPLGKAALLFFGLFAGIYLGSWIIALGEVVNIFSILVRRIGLTRGLPLIIFCMAAGKILGSLLYFYKGW